MTYDPRLCAYITGLFHFYPKKYISHKLLKFVFQGSDSECPVPWPCEVDLRLRILGQDGLEILFAHMIVVWGHKSGNSLPWEFSVYFFRWYYFSTKLYEEFENHG